MSFASHVLERIAYKNGCGLFITHEPNWRVSHPAVGTGCGTPGMKMISEGADIVAVCDDGFSYWQRDEQLFEMGVGVVMVSHGTSVMWGIENLARYLSKTFPELQVTYMDQHPRYWSISG